ncbi:uncharacterized protein [Pocillopora verrucosa]|uniref:uncharacterized protein n=1 Tax=Pocillopora verrucosa TaxID=203993 RepID=UPI00333EA414
MEWKVFLLFFALFVVATSAAPTCKCEDEDKETLSKYKVKAKDGDEEYEQEVKIDTEKQTETYHIPKTKSSSAGEVDEVYDFKRNLVMRRMPEHKACFLSESTENAPKPQDLKNALDKVTFLSLFESKDRCSNFAVKIMIEPSFFDAFLFP